MPIQEQRWVLPSIRLHVPVCGVRPFNFLLGSLAVAVMATTEVNASVDTTSTFDLGAFSHAGAAKVDLSRFDKDNQIAPGTYRVDVSVNGEPAGRQDMRFAITPGSIAAVPCFNRTMLAQFGVDMKKIDSVNAPAAQGKDAGSVPANIERCGLLAGWIPLATSTFDAGALELSITVPQAYIKQSARGYVDPGQWDEGIDAALLSYNFSTSAATSGNSSNRTFLGVNSGLNLGAWRLRHQGAQGWNSGGRQTYQNTATYVQRSLTPLKSQLTIGDSFSGGQILDNVRLRGVTLATDDRMLPQSQQGYAPVVRGMADSNATVSVSQNGYRIYETTVAPGPFVIDDLFATGYGGDLTVIVREVDGRKTTFVVPYSYAPQLLRTDTAKYSVALGQLRQFGVQGASPAVAQGTVQYGLNNTVTLYSGGVLSEGYTQAKVGTALNTPVGSFSFDAAQANTLLPGQGALSGQNYGVAYNKHLPESGTNFVLGAYRFSTDGYLSLPDAANVRDLARRRQDTSQYARQKSRLDMTMSQKLGEGTLSLYGSSVDYWGGRQGRQTSYTIGYGSTWNTVSWNLSAQRSRVEDSRQRTQQEDSDEVFFGPANRGRIDNRYMLTLSMPLGSSPYSPTLSSMVSRSAGDTRASSQQVAINGSAGEQQEIYYGASGDRSSTQGSSTASSVNTHVGYRASAANLRAGYGQSKNNGQLSLGADGGLVLHEGGVTFSQSLGDAVALVHVPDAQGASLSNASNVQVDSRGYAVVPSLVPFQSNTVGIDPKGTAQDVELTETTQNVAPTAGAVTLLKYSTNSGRAVVVKALQANAQPLPFAAQVFDEKGAEVGVVGQASKAFVRGIADKGRLTVKWGAASDEQCVITYQLTPLGKGQRQASADFLQEQCVGTPSAAKKRTL